MGWIVTKQPWPGHSNVKKRVVKNQTPAWKSTEKRTVIITRKILPSLKSPENKRNLIFFKGNIKNKQNNNKYRLLLLFVFSSTTIRW